MSLLGPEFNVLRHDVSEALVDEHLDQMREQPAFMRVTSDEWDELSESWPNVRHYITASSTEISPEDPVMREEITASLVGLVKLIQKARNIEATEAIARFSSEMSGHPTKRKMSLRRILGYTDETEPAA